MSENPTITMIYSTNIMSIWPHVYPLLEPAISIAETHNMEDLRKALLGGQAHLWVQWKDGVEAAVITEFINYPRGLWFRLWLAGAAKDVKVEWEDFFETLVKFGVDNKCAGIEDCGRSGWNKYCPDEVRNVGVVRRMPFQSQPRSNGMM